MYIYTISNRNQLLLGQAKRRVGQVLGYLVQSKDELQNKALGRREMKTFVKELDYDN